MTAYEWVQGDHETVETDLTTLDGAPSDLDLTGRTVHFVLRHYQGAKVADKQASKSGTTATVELTSENLSRTYSHEAEWVITGGGDDPTSLPKDEPIDVDVRPSVDDDDNVAEPLPEDATVDVLTANGFDGPITGGLQTTNLVGTNLTVNGGTLEATDTDTTDHSQLTNVQSGQHHPALSVSEDGTLVLAEPTDISFGSDLAVVDESDGTVRVDYSGSGETDTRTNISEGGTELVTNVTDIDFVGDVSVADDNDGSVTVTFTGTKDHAQLTNVQSGQHHAKTTSTDLESGGSDTLDVSGLPGDLADAQDPKTHDHAGQSISPQSTETDELDLNAHGVYIQSTAPSAPSDGDIWFDLP